MLEKISEICIMTIFLYLTVLLVGYLSVKTYRSIINTDAPTVEQCETILNQNPEMCLSVCVEEFTRFGC